MKSFKCSLCHLRHPSQSATIHEYTGDAALLAPVLTELLGFVFFPAVPEAAISSAISCVAK